MSLSQDEINALLTVNPNDTADAEPVEIMSPEDIAAMLNDGAMTTAAQEEPGSVDIMTPEDIAAMLNENTGATAGMTIFSTTSWLELTLLREIRLN